MEWKGRGSKMQAPSFEYEEFLWHDLENQFL